MLSTIVTAGGLDASRVRISDDLRGVVLSGTCQVILATTKVGLYVNPRENHESQVKDYMADLRAIRVPAGHMTLSWPNIS